MKKNLRPQYIDFIPGPWTAWSVFRNDAGGLFNAVHFEGERMIESEQTPTHSREEALRHASNLNRKFHEASGLGIPAAEQRLI